MPPFFSPYGIDAISVGIPYWIDLLTVIVGAISGILVARERHLDLVGFIGLGLLGGLGGGLIRDIMMQQGGVYMLTSPYAIPAAVTASILLFIFPEPLDRFPRMLEWVDIVSVGLFAVVGTDKALIFHLLPFSIILMGSVTGVGGGMLRDVFLGDIPRIFQRSNLYAFCAVAGSLSYYLLVSHAGVTKVWAAIICVMVTVGLRRWSLKYNVLSPADVDLTPHVMKRVHKLRRSVRKPGKASK
mgnify:CR=1 FL=1